MPFLQKGAAALLNRMPKMISPKAHAVADYATIGAFLVLGSLFWRRDKRAAISAFICGGSELATTLMTDFPGGVTDWISFPTQGKIDMGLAAACTGMPEFMGFEDQPEAKWFRIMGLQITAVTALTDFGQLPARPQRRRAA